MKKRIHIGKEIKKKLTESGMTLTSFANKLNKERSTVYNIFDRESLDTALLQQISEILNYNFFQLFINNEPQKPVAHNTTRKKHKISVQIEIDDPDKEQEILKIILGNKNHC